MAVGHGAVLGSEGWACVGWHPAGDRLGLC